MPGDPVFIEYDYNLLLRALLKISYNSARAFADDKIAKHLFKYSSYIIDKSYLPKTVLKLQVVTASKRINLETGVDEGAFEPVHLRCATVGYDGRLSHRFLVRMIAINCFWFYIVSSYKKEPEHKWKEFLEGLNNWITPTGITLSPNKCMARIPREKTTYMHPSFYATLRSANA